jgi:membrane protein implicated in regulation of membrane protease activity
MDILNLTWIWLIVAVVFAVVEALTLGITSIWFAAGALAAFGLALIGMSFPIQVASFVIVSVALLVFTRPIASKMLNVGKEKTNVAAIIGKVGIVTKSMDRFSTGQVKVGGQVWTALGEAGSELQEGDSVEVVGVEGVKLIVKANGGRK